jgi:hypothetical protein
VIEFLYFATLGFAETLQNGGRIGDGPGDHFANELMRWIGVTGGAAISDELIEVECGGHCSLLNHRCPGRMFAQNERQHNREDSCRPSFEGTDG